MKLEVKTLDNKKAGDVTLDKAVFGVDIKQDVVHRVVNWQLAGRRTGSANTKLRSEVAGTGKKPWAQKGTGRARAGDLKRNIDRGGAVAFGPKPRSFAKKLPKKIRNLALKMVLTAKANDDKLIILDDAKADTHKTKPMAKALKALNIESAVIVGGEEIDAKFARATANIPHIDVLPVQGANVYDILRRDTLVLTQDAAKALSDRLKDQ